MSDKRYICNLCEKTYKTSQSLCNHKKIYHKNNNNLTQENSTSPQNNSNETQISPLLIDILIEQDNKTCKHCNKIYSRVDNLTRHLKTCKSKENIIKENEELKKELCDIKQDNKAMKQSLDELKKMILDMMNKKCKMHPKTFQKMVNSNNYSNNNITINNNIRYVEYGRENLNDVFSKKEKMMLLKSDGSIIENIFKYTHLNDDYPQFQNIIITNRRSNEAYAYNEKLNKFIVCDKNELLEDLIEFRYDDLISFFEEYKDLLEPKLRDTLERSFLRKNDKKFCKDKCKEFNVIIYNFCNKDNIKYKPVENLLNNKIDD